MNFDHGQVWQHRIQVLGEERPQDDWPTYYCLEEAEDAVVVLKENGVAVVAIHSTPLLVVNSPGGSS